MPSVTPRSHAAASASTREDCRRNHEQHIEQQTPADGSSSRTWNMRRLAAGAYVGKARTRAPRELCMSTRPDRESRASQEGRISTPSERYNCAALFSDEKGGDGIFKKSEAYTIERTRMN
eukprot:5129226-Pleurochrysis_carterae.AAC.1